MSPYQANPPWLLTSLKTASPYELLRERRYLLRLLRKASDYFNGEVALTPVQVEHLASTLKTVLAGPEE